MHELYELKEKLCRELEEYANKDMSAGSLEVIDKLAHATKNLGKIIEMADEGEYSMAGGPYGGRSYRGGSYARGHGGYSRTGGSYARGGGRGRGSNANRDSMGRYSSEGGYSQAADEIAMQIGELMEDAPEQIKGDLRRVMQKLEQM